MLFNDCEALTSQQAFQARKSRTDTVINQYAHSGLAAGMSIYRESECMLHINTLMGKWMTTT